MIPNDAIRATQQNPFFGVLSAWEIMELNRKGVQ